MRISKLMLIPLLVGTAYAQDTPHLSAQPAPTPAGELERLRSLAGKWSCQGVVPGTPKRYYKSNFTVEPIMNGFAYRVAYDQKEASPPYSGSWTVAWDGAQKKLIFFWLDNVGNVGVESAGNWQGDALLVMGEGFVPPGFVPTTLSGTAGFRDTFTRSKDGRFRWKGELKLHGTKAWTVIGEDDCTKS